MPSEMRRPQAIAIDHFVDALDRQLRIEAGKVQRRRVPQRLLRIVHVVRSALQPILQSGAIVLTSFAVIFAIGAAPATMRSPSPSDTPLAVPSRPEVIATSNYSIRDALPEDEFLAVGDETEPVQEADNPDMPPMRME